MVLGTVIRDRQDEGYLYIILGRDEDRRFRVINGEINYQTVNDAEMRLIEAMKQIASTGESAFPQGDESRKYLDLFTPIVPRERLHRHIQCVTVMMGDYVRDQDLQIHHRLCGRHTRKLGKNQGGTAMGIKKPLIRQAGSAEAFAGSAATGREHLQN
ncbi:MAG: hypothetical protein HQL93_03515 [Magnetococcales bacterium]|nr:hypothetical protein [Magnetococcales bacterium]